MEQAFGAAAVPVVQSLLEKEHPLQLAGKLVGLGRAEVAAGVPKWAWFGVGVVFGATALWVYGDEVKRWMKR